MNDSNELVSILALATSGAMYLGVANVISDSIFILSSVLKYAKPNYKKLKCGSVKFPRRKVYLKSEAANYEKRQRNEEKRKNDSKKGGKEGRIEHNTFYDGT